MSELPDLPPAPFLDTPKLNTNVDEFGDEFSEGQMEDFDNEVIDDNSGGGSGPGGYQSFAEKMTVYKHGDKRLAVPQRWYWGNIVKRMLNHNKAHGYTGCVLIGMSGSGKTTLTNTILHKIHEYGENYVYKWFNGHQLIELDKHIQDLQVGVPHVMIFDDASYTMENATKAQMAVLANALTTIRHHVKSRVIIIFNIHYSRATKKFFRNQHFTFLTSVTTEELGNLKDLFQDKMQPVRQFAKKYRQMALLGHFFVPMDFYSGKSVKYKINEPFRIGMVSEITDLHFFVYPRQACEICRPGAGPKFKEKSVKEVVTLLKSYKNQSALMTTLGFWIKLHNLGPDPLENAYKSYWRFFEKLSKDVKVPWNEVFEQIREGKKRTAKVGQHLNKKADIFKATLGGGETGQTGKKVGRPALTKQQRSKRLHAHETENPEDYVSPNEIDTSEANNTSEPETAPVTEFPDYDSTYVRPPE
tara:strand:+ start:31359 stop:32774 length:1416 start_codon:yes stop_codon:yes gene_type:complete